MCALCRHTWAFMQPLLSHDSNSNSNPTKRSASPSSTQTSLNMCVLCYHRTLHEQVQHPHPVTVSKVTEGPCTIASYCFLPKKVIDGSMMKSATNSFTQQPQPYNASQPHATNTTTLSTHQHNHSHLQKRWDKAGCDVTASCRLCPVPPHTTSTHRRTPSRLTSTDQSKRWTLSQSSCGCTPWPRHHV